MATAMITRPGISNVDTSGWIILSTDSLRDPIPAPRMMKAIAMVVIYSIRPWPNGCSLSAPLAANFVPTIVNTEDNTSVKLFTASRMMAMELDARPTIILKITRTTLPIMPFILASVIPRLRAAPLSCKIILHLLHSDL